MQNFILTLMLSFLLLGKVVASDFTVAEMEEMDRDRVAFYVKEHELESSPPWEPGKGSIPVSVDQAIDAVMNWARNRNTNNREILVNELVLKQVRSGDNRLYWHYLVRYREMLEDGSPTPKDSVAAVLLGGKVFPVVTLPPL